MRQRVVVEPTFRQETRWQIIDRHAGGGQGEAAGRAPAGSPRSPRSRSGNRSAAAAQGRAQPHCPQSSRDAQESRPGSLRSTLSLMQRTRNVSVRFSSPPDRAPLLDRHHDQLNCHCSRPSAGVWLASHAAGQAPSSQGLASLSLWPGQLRASASLLGSRHSSDTETGRGPNLASRPAIVFT
eukprot:COSAG02_NODE_492_length_21210_cov_13.381176_8_plen_182_part_00